MKKVFSFKQIHEKLKNPTETAIETEIEDKVEDGEIAFLNGFLKDGETIDGETYKSIDSVVSKYKEKVKSDKDDTNLQMLAPIIAAMITTIEMK